MRYTEVISVLVTIVEVTSILGVAGNGADCETPYIPPKIGTYEDPYFQGNNPYQNLPYSQWNNYPTWDSRPSYETPQNNYKYPNQNYRPQYEIMYPNYNYPNYNNYKDQGGRLYEVNHQNPKYPDQNIRSPYEVIPGNHIYPNRKTGLPHEPPTNIHFPPRFGTDNIDAASYNEAECGVPLKVNQLIVNGKPYKQGKYPWLAALFSVRDEDKLTFRCGGTLISKKHVITAGHCVVHKNATKDAKKLLIALGESNLKHIDSEDDTVYKIKSVHLHPDYKLLSSDGDIAILVLKATVHFNDFVRPACLWTGTNYLEEIVGETGTVAGWGRDEDGDLSLAQPKEIKIPVVSQETCLRSHQQYTLVTSERTFCAGFRDGSGPCNGDSGSGYIIQRHGQWLLRGIVSLSISDGIPVNGCDLSYYVVFTDVSKFIPWINSIMSLNKA